MSAHPGRNEMTPAQREAQRAWIIASLNLEDTPEDRHGVYRRRPPRPVAKPEHRYTLPVVNERLL